MGSRYETVATAEVCPAGTARSPVRPCPLMGPRTQPSLWACLWVKEYLRQDYRGLEDLLASSAELRAALGWVFDVPRVHAASGDPHVAEGGLVLEAFPAGGDGLFPTPGQPRLREAHGASSAGEAVPDVVDGRVGPAPGHLGPGGSGRPREPVSVASAVGPGSRPASVGLCRPIDGFGRSRVSRASSRPRGVVPDGPGPPAGVVGPVTSPAGNTVDGGSPRRSLRSSSGNSERPGRPAGSRLSCGVWSTTFGGPLWFFGFIGSSPWVDGR
jgi:hypothetical protein